MSKLNLPKPKKKFGQHFLRDQKVIKTICDQYIQEAKSIIEVGPGPGVLTQHLSKRGLPFSVVEIDTDQGQGLKTWVPSQNIHLLDALTVSWDELIKNDQLPQPVWLVSNLPYNVGSVLLVHFLESASISYMTLMFQKEVALKTLGLDEKRRHDLSSLAALTQTYFDVELLAKVSPGAFHPPPKVDSLVVNFKRLPGPPLPLSEFREFEAFLRPLFREKRKQLGHVLKKMMNSTHPVKNQDAFERDLAHLSICKKDRAQDLTLLQVQGLYKSLRSR